MTALKKLFEKPRQTYWDLKYGKDSIVTTVMVKGPLAKRLEGYAEKHRMDKKMVFKKYLACILKYYFRKKKII
jgi:hypothetical protein